MRLRYNGPLMIKAGEADGGVGAGEQKPPTFDQAAFKTEILAELNKTVNGAIKGLKGDLSKMFHPQEQSSGTESSGDSAAGTGTDATAGQATGSKVLDPAVNAELQLLRKQIKTLTTGTDDLKKERDAEKQARMETERQTAIRNVLNSIEFRDQESRDLVFQAVQPAVKRDENGALVAESASGPVTYDAHIKSYVDRFPYLLAPRGAGGAGASNGKTAGGSQKWTMADITPSKMATMKPEEIADMAKEIMAGRVT
jgi:hypothetical protein